MEEQQAPETTTMEGEGNQPEKAYAAAFVLLLVVIGLNLVAGRLGRRPTWTT